jgi:glycosyltransferase involved in cell wall biosynthesis
MRSVLPMRQANKFNKGYIMNKISVIMPAFNSEKTIAESIQSVIDQSHPNWELIVCDDGSNDATAAIVNSYNDDRVSLIRNRYMKGASGARNSCIDVASGEYFCFLDSDDVWGRDKLLNQINHMIANGHCCFSYGPYYTFCENVENVLGVFTPKEEIFFKDLIKTCDIGCLTVMLKRDAFPGFKFPQSPKEDYAAWLVLLKNGAAAVRCPSVDSYYRLSAHSLSGNKFKELYKQWFVLRNYGDLSFSSSFLHLFFYVINGLFKHSVKYMK